MKARFGVRARRNSEYETGIFVVYSDQEHRSSGDKTASRFEAFQPRLGANTPRQVHINAAEAQRHRMHAIRRAGGWAKAKATIEQGIVIQEAIERPFKFVIATAFNVHPARGGHSPVGDRKRSFPVVVIR